MWILGLTGLGLILFGGGWFLRAILALKRNRLALKARVRTKAISIAILIPARDESAVILNLLKSLEQQTLKINFTDIYVIVESENDPTVKLCEDRGVQVVVRQTKLARKGAALDEAVKQILKSDKTYDLYFVFDADNTLSRDYLEKMTTLYDQGYAMATGYRMPQNGSQNLIAAVSALTFTMVNVLGNRTRVKHHGNVIFSGTGLFVTGELVQKWGGWPFQSLTEDYEMSLYATLENIPTYYYEETCFYDEQPTRYRQTVMQRVRWIRGYFDARKIYVAKLKQRLRGQVRPANYGSLVREIAGVGPLILIVIGLVLILLASGLTWLLADFHHGWWLIVLLLFAIYGILMITTIVMLSRERTKFRSTLIWKICLFNPLYLLTYIPCALKAILSPKVKWDKIQHGKKP